MNENGDMLVLPNRLSWNKFEKVRKSQGLTTRKRKESLDENKEGQSISEKRRHGCSSSSLNIDKEQLLNEAHSWQPDQHMNWSELGLQYGLHMANRGQIIKEFLAEHGIQAAQKKQYMEEVHTDQKNVSQAVKCLFLCTKLRYTLRKG